MTVRGRYQVTVPNVETLALVEATGCPCLGTLMIWIFLSDHILAQANLPPHTKWASCRRQPVASRNRLQPPLPDELRRLSYRQNESQPVDSQMPLSSSDLLAVVAAAACARPLGASADLDA